MTKKTIVITGAASGIGLATAQRLSREGWIVGVFDLDQSTIDEACSTMQPDTVHGIAADVTDPEAFAAALEAFASKAGGIRAIFNNAGLLGAGEFAETALKQHHLTTRVNAEGVINGCHLALPYLKASGPGAHCINMSSASTLHGVPGLSTYSASKAFVEHLSEALSIEWEAHGAVVSTVAVPFVKTPMIDNDQDKIEGLVTAQGAMVGPEAVAEKVSEILSGRAGSQVHHNITGALKTQRLLKRLLPSGVIRGMVAKSYRGS